MAIEYVLKEKLKKIIDYAYQEYDPVLKERFTWFRLEVQLKDKISRNGTYNSRTHKIVVNNIEDEGNNIKTLLHEVAHHIDWCIHGYTGHQKEFYEVYKRLLYAALDLDVVSLEQLQNIQRRSSDYNKVQKMLQEYEPKKRIQKESKENLYVVRVKNCYEKKDLLKNHGYFWNKVAKSWDKDGLTEEQVKEENGFLKEFDLEGHAEFLADDKLRFSK